VWEGGVISKIVEGEGPHKWKTFQKKGGFRSSRLKYFRRDSNCTTTPKESQSVGMKRRGSGERVSRMESRVK